MASLSDQEQHRRLAMLGEVFRPSAPITDQQLFAGRNHELFSVVEAIQSVGQHAVIFGERGVGKTSLARVAMQTQRGTLAVRVNCDGGDTYTSIWDKVLEELAIAIGELPAEEQEALTSPLAASIDTLKQQEVTPSSVRVALRKISIHRPVAVFIDEFNEISDSSVRALISNTIKALSDHIEPITICPVGIAEDLDALLEGHLSAVRAIVQVRMPRMSGEELQEIVKIGGLERLEMEIDADALNLIRVVTPWSAGVRPPARRRGARDAPLASEGNILAQQRHAGPQGGTREAGPHFEQSVRGRHL